MAFLILPPVQFIADSQEIPKQIVQKAQAYQKNFLKDLNITTTASTVTQGAYKGAQIFNWDQKYNGILMTSILFQKGQNFNKEWMRTATLLRQEDCIHMGSLWSFDNKKISSFTSRVFNTISPVRMNLQAQFSDKRYSEIFNLELLEEFSKKNVPTISDIGRLYCKAESFNTQKNEQKTEYPAKPHRIVNINVTENSQKIDYSMQMASGVFGQKSKDINEKKTQEKFDPQKISKNFVEKIFPTLDDVSQEEFKITKRVGSWVYLNKGRAYGLSIGMRLVGAHSSKLHIIRYVPNPEGELDGSIAFIRHEDKEAPLVVGDILKLDNRIYPK
ncbi:MAG: hypothetical protein V4591_01030 [Bdellovibrionota bacterium]